MLVVEEEVAIDRDSGSLRERDSDTDCLGLGISCEQNVHSWFAKQKKIIVS